MYLGEINVFVQAPSYSPHCTWMNRRVLGPSVAGAAGPVSPTVGDRHVCRFRPPRWTRFVAGGRRTSSLQLRSGAVGFGSRPPLPLLQAGLPVLSSQLPTPCLSPPAAPPGSRLSTRGPPGHPRSAVPCALPSQETGPSSDRPTSKVTWSSFLLSPHLPASGLQQSCPR